MEYSYKLASGKSYKVNSDSLSHVGKGGTSTVKLHATPDGTKHAIKIYNPNEKVEWEKLRFITSHLSAKKKKYSFESFNRSAWPIAILEHDGAPKGIVTQYFPPSDYSTLDHWIEYHLLNKIEKNNDSLSRRLRLLRSLSQQIADLHKVNICIVDLKPANVLVHKETSETSLIDCDSFRIPQNYSKVFPASHYSSGYICPEFLNSRDLDIGSLSEEQDLFALAVIIFQVLNYGVHPFQGILTGNVADAPTNDNKAQKGLYAYGMRSSARIKPIPQSVHMTWPQPLRRLLNKAFTSKQSRPKASEWAEYFQKVLSEKALKPCTAHPKDVRHIRFDGMGCPFCHREEVVNNFNPSKRGGGALPAKSTKTSFDLGSSQSKNYNIHAPKANDQGPPIFLWIVFLLFVIGLFYVVNLDSEKDKKSDAGDTFRLGKADHWSLDTLTRFPPLVQREPNKWVNSVSEGSDRRPYTFVNFYDRQRQYSTLIYADEHEIESVILASSDIKVCRNSRPGDYHFNAVSGEHTLLVLSDLAKGAFMRDMQKARKNSKTEFTFSMPTYCEDEEDLLVTIPIVGMSAALEKLRNASSY